MGNVSNRPPNGKGSRPAGRDGRPQSLRDVAKELRRLRQLVNRLFDRLPEEEEDESLLTREEAADRLNISVRKLDRLREAGEIQAVQIDRAVRYHPKTLDRFIRRRAGGGNRR